MTADALAVPSTTVLASWRGDRRYEIGRPSGPLVMVDGAAVAGPSPVDVLLGALAACSAIDIVEYLAKRRTPLAALEIVVVADRRTTPPRRVVNAALEIRISGEGIEPVHAERAIALSFTTYCSVAASLAPDTVIETQLVLNSEPYPRVRQHVGGATA